MFLLSIGFVVGGVLDMEEFRTFGFPRDACVCLCGDNGVFIILMLVCLRLPEAGF